MIGYMTMILQLTSFLNISYIEYAKSVKRIAVYILMKKPFNLVRDWRRIPDRLFDNKISKANRWVRTVLD